MVTPGGEQRRLVSQYGKDLSFARLLFKALYTDESVAGQQFLAECESLYQRWRGFILDIVGRNGSSPFGVIESVNSVLDTLEPDGDDGGHAAQIAIYRAAVSEFAEQWRLKAWWASPALTRHHFLRAEEEETWDQSTPPLKRISYDLEPPENTLLIVALPGRLREQFEKDQVTARVRTEHNPYRTGSPSRDWWANWEAETDASCVVLDWDGLPYLAQNLAQIMGSGTIFDEAYKVTPVDYLLERCERRLGRPLKPREVRRVKSQIHEQRQEFQRHLAEAGWTAVGDGDIELVSRVLARRLLTPSATWTELMELYPIGDRKNSYQEPRALRRAVAYFARAAKLTLPSRQTTR